MPDFGEYWIWNNRDTLQTRYGAGMYVAVYNDAVVDWGIDPVEVRFRAELLLGDAVYVGVVPPDEYVRDTGLLLMDQRFEGA